VFGHFSARARYPLSYDLTTDAAAEFGFQGRETNGRAGVTTDLTTIAIIGGTGAEGSGLALRLANAGHRVILGSRDAAKAQMVAEQLNAMLDTARIGHDTVVAAATAAKVVILTVPYAAQLATLEDIRHALAGKILVDATVPLIPPKVSVVQLPGGESAVARAQALLGAGVRVVSAFQNVAAHKLRHLTADVDCDVLVCADDVEARALVIALAQRIGLRAIDAGPIVNSIAAEALTSVLININRKYKLPGSGIRITGLGA
jgi:8-hydroxy-5-deazaflavin:NADPH oxidoreductase